MISYKCNTCRLITNEYFKNCPGCGGYSEKIKEVKFNTMNNELLSLEIKDMYAIKHSLQAALRYKRNKLEKETGLFYRDRLTKDIAREEILLDKFIILIEETKEK